MAKRRRGPDFDETAEFNTVFVDTSLDTHLAVLVSSSDTVSDFRKKIAVEHNRCFPNIGEIQVHSVKVERRSNFYHLPDIMLLWSAFYGEVRGNWFLSVDVSGAHACHSIKNSLEFNTSNGEVMGIPNYDNNCRALVPVNRIQGLPMPLADGATEKTIESEMVGGIRFEKSVEKNTEFQSQICLEEKCLGTDSRPRKKCKIRKTEDECRNRSSGDDRALFEASGYYTSKPEIVSCANLMADSVKGSPGGGILPESNRKSFSGATGKVPVVRNDHFKETSTRTTEEKGNSGNTVTLQNLLASDETKHDNLLEGKMDSKHSDGVSVDVPDHVARSMDVGGGVGEVNIDGSKLKKKKNKKGLTTAGELQDTTGMEQIGNGESMKTCSETLKSDLMEDEKGSPLDKNLGVVNNKASDHLDPVSMLKVSSADAVIEPEISCGGKQKKKKKLRKDNPQQKKSVDTNLENSGIDQTDNFISSSSGLLLQSADHIPEETDRGEGYTHHDEKYALILLDSSTLDTPNKVQGVDGNEAAGSVMLTQTEQASEDGVSEKKKADKSAQSSSGNCNADNTVMEFNKVDNSENTGSKNIKASTKRKKKQKLTVAEDQEVGVDAIATKETSISVVNSEQVGRQVESSQVLYSKTDEELKKIHGIAENTDDLKASEKEGERINFKRYFVHDQDQHKEDSGDKLKKDLKSKVETSKRDEDNDLPFVSNSAEPQNSSKSLVNKKAENKPHRGLAQNSDRDEAISNSFRRSSGASEEEVKDSSHRLEKTLQKPDESLAASSRLNKKNQTLDKSTSVRSEVLPRKQGNKRLQPDLNVTNMIPMKTPLKSLLTKSGPIFQENSDESSGDENGTGESLAASSFLKKKYRTSDKSSSVRSEVLPRKQGNRRLQSGLNVTSMIPVKTPQKKSLFTKSGAIFQDNGGESSGDENGAMHSDGNTVCPSDSSSMSGDSDGGSDLSQDSTRNGSSDVGGRRTGRRNMLKLDLSASKDLTLDMILRSSKRFRTAKLLASQIESQEIEFVPDSQPS